MGYETSQGNTPGLEYKLIRDSKTQTCFAKKVVNIMGYETAKLPVDLDIEFQRETLTL